MLPVLLLVFLLTISCGSKCDLITGELKTWHKVTLTIDGPQASEEGDMNPFLDCRFDVVFTNGRESYVVPGYFAADGNASETSASSGTVWKAHFIPPTAGEWQYTTFFRQGEDIAISCDPSGVQATTCSGSFTVTPTDKKGSDFRGKGLLEYVGESYLQFAGTGEYFIKGGTDSPENFLAYADFDGTVDQDGLSEDEETKAQAFLHEYAPHADDWKDGDPSWQGGKGKNMIGALNYLASKGMNSVYFLPMNVTGDGKDVWPWTGYDERFRFDVSKLDQWEIVFSHMDELGLMMHVITQETENDQLLDGGDLGRERKLYYRELIARFAHHPALVWNLGEENTNTNGQRKAFCEYFQALDPYDHPVVVHTFPGQWSRVYESLTGFPYIEGPSLQIGDQTGVHSETVKWLDRSCERGRQWFVCLDEIGPHTAGVVPDADDFWHDDVRNYSLWGTLMAGGAGVEWYFGYLFAHTDLNCEDWRSREHMWDLTKYALDFFNEYLPFTEMRHHDELTAAADDYCFAKPGEIYAVYLPRGGSTGLDLGESSLASYSVQWYNPRTGGELQDGTVTSINGPGTQSIGMPPADTDKDWVALVRAEKVIFEEVDGIVAVEAEHFTSQERIDVRRWHLTSRSKTPAFKPDSDPNHAATASGGAYMELLPDTRQTHDDQLIQEENFTEIPGQMAVLSYDVQINKPGRYYVWARLYSTGSEDNGLHVGLNDEWPDSGVRMQWCEGKNSWRWESRQRTNEEHCGIPYAIYLDIDEPGLHTVSFSMREDGVEFDIWLMTTNRDYPYPRDESPPEKVKEIKPLIMK